MQTNSFAGSLLTGNLAQSLLLEARAFSFKTKLIVDMTITCIYYFAFIHMRFLFAECL